MSEVRTFQIAVVRETYNRKKCLFTHKVDLRRKNVRLLYDGMKHGTWTYQHLAVSSLS